MSLQGECLLTYNNNKKTNDSFHWVSKVASGKIFCYDIMSVNYKKKSNFKINLCFVDKRML